MTTTNKISRTVAEKTILNSKGRFFKVIFKKNEGQIREMNCKLAKNQEGTTLGYIRVWEPGKNGGFKNVDTRTISKLNIDNQQFTVK